MAVLASCKTAEQLEVAIIYKNNYLKYYNPPSIYARTVSKVTRTLSQELIYI